MLSKDFVDALKSNDTRKARIIFENHMILDPTFQDVDEMIEYIQSNRIDFFEPYNGEEIEVDPENLSEDDIDEQMFCLHDNYSLERVALIKKISRAIYCNELFYEANITDKHTEETEKSASEECGKQTNGKVKIIIAVGAAILVIGIIIAAVVLSKGKRL